MNRAKFAASGVLAIDVRAFDLDWLLFEPPPAFEMRGAVAVVSIVGPVEQRAGWFDGYDAILSRVQQALAKTSARAVLLRIDSPGGAAPGMTETSRALRAMAAAARKPLYAFADTYAASAGYGLACAASKIFLPESGEVGSIGTLAAMADVTEANAKSGVRVIVASSGAQKSDGCPDVPATDDAIARMQARVDYHAGLFFDLVSEARGIPAASVRAFEAGLFNAPAAVAAGLADAVMTFDQVIALITQEAAMPLNEADTKLASDALASAREAATNAEDAALKAAAQTFVDAVTPMLGDGADAAADEAATARREADAIAAEARAVTGHASAAEVAGALRGVAARATAHDAVASRVAKLEAKAADDERRGIIAANRSKITPALEPWALTQSPAALRAFCAAAPDAVPTTPRTQLAKPDAAALTEEELAVCKALGTKPEDFIKHRNARAARLQGA